MPFGIRQHDAIIMSNLQRPEMFLFAKFGCSTLLIVQERFSEKKTNTNFFHSMMACRFKSPTLITDPVVQFIIYSYL